MRCGIPPKVPTPQSTPEQIEHGKRLIIQYAYRFAYALSKDQIRDIASGFVCPDDLGGVRIDTEFEKR